MACIIKYKGKTYSEREFKEFAINNYFTEFEGKITSTPGNSWNEVTITPEMYKPIMFQLPDRSKQLTQNIVFYPAQFTTVAYDSKLGSWIMKVDEDAAIGGERKFHKDGWTYTYAPWMEEDLEEREVNKAYSRYKIEGKQVKTEVLTKEEWEKDRSDIDDNPFSVKQITFEEAKRLWESYKKSQQYLRDNNPFQLSQETAKSKLIKRLQSETLVNKRPFTYKGKPELTVRKVDNTKDFIADQGRVYNLEANIKALEDINKTEFAGKKVIELVPSGRVVIVRINEQLLAENQKTESSQLIPKGDRIDTELRAKLIAFVRKYGFREESVDRILTKAGTDAVAAVDWLEKVIKVAKGMEGADTISEEAAHIALELLWGHPYYNRIMELIGSTERYEQVKRDYSEAYQGDEELIKKEAAGQLLRDVIQKRWREMGNQNVLFRVLTKAWEYIKRAFGKTVYSTIESELNDIATRIADDMFSENMQNFDAANVEATTRKKPMYQLAEESKTLKKLRETLEQAIEVTHKKITLYGKRGTGKDYVKREKKLRDKMHSSLEKDKAVRGLLNFIASIRFDLGKTTDEGKILGKLATFGKVIQAGDPNRAAKSLKDILNYVHAFKPILESVVDTVEDDSEMMQDKRVVKLIEEVKDIQKGIDKAEKLVKKHMYAVIGPVWEEFNGKYSYDVKGNRYEVDWIEAFKNAPTDISWAERLLDSLSDSKDIVLQGFDKITKSMKGEAQRNSDEAIQRITNEHMKLEKAGFAPVDVVAEKDQGKITGNWVTRFNIGRFQRARHEFGQDLRKKYGLKTGEKRPADPKKAKDWSKEWGLWYENNTEWVDNYEQIMKDREAELKAEYGDKVGDQLYKDWLGKNTKTSTYNGQGFMTARGELQRPADKYINPQFDEILNNKDKKAYYDVVYGLHMDAVGKLSEGHQMYMWHTLPQVMKEYLERAKDKGLDASGQWKEAKTTFKNAYVRHDGDIEFNTKDQMTDEADKPAYFLPINYVNILKSKQDLSLDISATVARFYDSAENFHQMSKVIHILEIGKELMKDRTYDRRDAFNKLMTDPVSFFKDKKRKLVKDSTEATAALDRIETYGQMNWYGNLKKDEGQLFGTGIDRAKLIDMLGRYISINNLALNLYSGISNVTYGNAMLIEEGVAGEYYGLKDMAWAGGEYTAQMAISGLLEMGQRNKSNKLHLWNRLMDTFEEHNRALQDLNLHSGTRLGQALDTDSLYAFNSAGEHQLQSTLSLSLANTLRFGKDGEPVWKKDFTGTTEEWSKMPNLYDVMEVTDENLLVPKKGYNISSKILQLFKDRQSFINHSLNGIYNEIDRSALQWYSLGRQALLFRKYIKPGFNRRFRAGAYYHGPELYREGFWYTTLDLTTFNLFRKIKASLEGRQYSLMTQWNNITDHQKANLWRAGMEFAFMMAGATLAYCLKNLGDDDDDNWALNMLAYQANRNFTEISAWVPGPWAVESILTLIKSPAAGVTMLQNVSNMADLLFLGGAFDITEGGIELEVIKSGYNKGEYKLTQGVKSLLPPWRTIDRLLHPSEQLLYYSKR